MPPERDGETYCGPFVIVRPDPPGYTILIEPRLPTGEGAPRHFRCKLDAFAAAAAWWTKWRLPCRDETERNVNRSNIDRE